MIDEPTPQDRADYLLEKLRSWHDRYEPAKLGIPLALLNDGLRTWEVGLSHGSHGSFYVEARGRDRDTCGRRYTIDESTLQVLRNSGRLTLWCDRVGAR